MILQLVVLFGIFSFRDIDYSINVLPQCLWTLVPFLKEALLKCQRTSSYCVIVKLLGCIVGTGGTVCECC